MKKTIKKITEWRNAFEGRLRGRLEALPPKARLMTVLVLFSLFTVGCLAMLGTAASDVYKRQMLGTAIRDFGKGSEPMRIEHIGQFELPSREQPTVLPDYGTGQTDCETENLTANETE